MRYQGYTGTVQYSAAEGVYYGRLKGIRDVVLYQAGNEFELAQRFRETVDGYLAFCADEGRTPDVPETPER